MKQMALFNIMKLVMVIEILVLGPAIIFFPDIATAMIEEEKRALLQTKWWDDHCNLSKDDPCKCDGIQCNDVGGVMRPIESRFGLSRMKF